MVTDIRGFGMLAGIDFAAGAIPAARRHEIQKRLFDAGLQVKTTEDAAIIAPELIVESGHIDELCETLRGGLKGY